ncbi:MAG: outer membrane beta-barrel domain-containing protein [Gammaproteobacteria bacterium]
MESRLISLFLTLLRTGFIVSVFGAGYATAAEHEQVIEPEIERRDIVEPAIDAENIELGLFAGFMNVQDFGTNPVYGARLSYHVTEDIFIEAAYGRTETDETSFERLSGNIQLLPDNDHTLSYYSASFGYNILPGEGFFGRKHAFTSALFLIGGIGGTDFAGDDHTTWNIGAGYRVLLKDWISLRLDARDYIFDIDLLGEKQTNHDLEFTAGVSLYF